MRKIQGQEKLSEMYPPRIGPHTGAIIAVIAQMPSAAPRLAGGKIMISKICDPGCSGPDAAPWNIRNKIRLGKFQDIPHRNEASVNNATAATKIFTTP